MGARLRLEPSILLPEAWRPRPRRQYFTLPSGESMLWYNHHFTFLYQDPIGLPFEAACTAAAIAPKYIEHSPARAGVSIRS